MKLKFIAALLLCIGCGASAWAAQQCPLGIPSEGNPLCIPPNDPSSPYYNGGGSGSAPPTPRIVWADRWGAIAFDSKTSKFGAAENQKSKARAEQAATADCGTQGCQIIFPYANECVALTGKAGGIGVAGAPKVEDAIARAMEQCSKYGPGCQTVYSACSLPVRIQ
jgi:hypothetical protein